MRMFMACFVSIFILTKSVTAEADLQQQNQEHLNPINEPYDHPSKNQDKRTIFSHGHHGWAKHVGVHPSGFKYIIGYGPVDLKYVPVVKPISIRGPPQIIRPKWHVKKPLVLKPLLPVRPSVVHQDGWRPVAPIVKPVVPVIKPVVPVNVPAPPHLVHKPWQQPGWASVKPVAVVKPVPIKPIHHVPVKPVVPFIPSKPLIPVHPVQPVAPAPLVPIQPVLRPIVQTPFFEVTKPNLPVLPFGATFPHPILHQVPTAPSGAPLHNPAILGQYAPSSVEYHGTHHFVSPVHQHPVVYPPQHPVVVQPQPVAISQHPAAFPPHQHPVAFPPHQHPVAFPPHQHPVVLPQAPPHQHPIHPPHEQHDVQTPIIPENHPHFHQHIFQQQVPEGHQVFQQQLPEEHQVFQQHQPEGHHVFQQQLPEGHQLFQQQAPEGHQVIQQQLPEDGHHAFHQHPHIEPQNQPFLYQQELPGNSQHLFNQQIQHGDGGTSNIYLQGSNIQPGQTDVQLPIHLPQHPNYLPEQGNFDQQGQPENIFRPSISLEPPFHK